MLLHQSGHENGGLQPPGFSNRPGVSLLEVLVALAIFLLSMVAIGQLIDVATDSALDANAQATGIRLAQSKLAELEAGLLPVANGSTAGVIEEEVGWSYEIQSSPTDITNVYAVTVTLTNIRNGKQTDVSMSQMIFDPTQSGNASPAQKPTTSTTSGGTGQ